jgi:hypothetical protein
MRPRAVAHMMLVHWRGARCGTAHDDAAQSVLERSFGRLCACERVAFCAMYDDGDFDALHACENIEAP